VRCEQRADDDSGNHLISESQRHDCAQNLRHRRRQQSEEKHAVPAGLEPREVHLEAGHEHQQELAEFGEESDDGPVRTEQLQAVRADDEAGQKQTYCGRQAQSP